MQKLASITKVIWPTNSGKLHPEPKLK